MAKDFLKQIEENETNKKEIEEIEKEFEKKPYFIEYRTLAKVAYYAKFFFALVSVLCALYFLQSIFFEAIRVEAVALIFAILMLAIIEVLKLKVTPIFLRKTYTQKGINIEFLLLNVAIISLSVFLSVKGIEQYSNEKLSEKPNLSNIDSLRASYQKKKNETILNYQKQINALNREKKEFKASVSYMGKINMYHKGTAQTIVSFDKQIENLQREKTKDLKSIEQSKQSILREKQKTNDMILGASNAKNSQNTFYLILLALANELFGFACLWYFVYYRFRSKKEKDLISKGQTIEINQQSVLEMFSYMKNLGINPSSHQVRNTGSILPTNRGQFGSNEQEFDPNQENSPIGFVPNGSLTPNADIDEINEVKPSSTQTSNKSEKTKITQYLAKYKDVVEEFQKGDLTQREMTRVKYKVYELRGVQEKYLSLSTIKNIKRTLDNVKQAKAINI